MLTSSERARIQFESQGRVLEELRRFDPPDDNYRRTGYARAKDPMGPKAGVAVKLGTKVAEVERLTKDAGKPRPASRPSIKIPQEVIEQYLSGDDVRTFYDRYGRDVFLKAMKAATTPEQRNERRLRLACQSMRRVRADRIAARKRKVARMHERAEWAC